MSSFIVSEKTMNNIIYNLFWDHNFKNSYGSLLERNGYKTEEDFNRLYTEFYIMNRNAIIQRYNEKEGSDYIKLPEKINWDNGTLNKFQCLKDMKCLRYQCSEGNVPDTRLYKFLEELIEAYMSYIIEELPQYNNASWD
jgi:hypothetical protein